MPTPPPSQDELLALAERALGHCDGEAQASARWVRELSAGYPGAEVAQGVVVELAIVRDGHVGLLATADLDDDGLRRAARGAADLAEAALGGLPGARLGDPTPGRTHTGYDPAVLGLDAGTAAAALAASSGAGGAFRAMATKLAIVSSRGVRAYEQRTAAELRVRREAPGGRWLAISEAAVGPAGVDPARLAAEADALLGSGDPVPVPAGGEHAVVLGPWAVAEVLRRAALAFSGPNAQTGPLAGRFGTRVVAPAINLSDSPRFPGTLPRSYDAEGVPRQPVPLIQDGVAHRAVHDSTSAAMAGTVSTGHATLPGGLVGPLPDHLVLVGGGAADLDELAAPLESGLLIPALSSYGAWTLGERGTALAEGVRVIRDGQIAEPAGNLPVAFEPLDLLAHVQALTARQRTVPAPHRVPAPSMGATVCPGLRAGGGLYGLGPG
jgi:predicted Zn-dependent protease